MSMNLGYLVGTAIFAALFVAAVCCSRSRPSGSIPRSTGRRSLPRPRSAPPWPTSPTARSGSATPAARRCCSPCCCFAVRLVSHARLHLGRNGEHAQGRDVLLGDDHVLADAGHRAGRLDRGHRRPGLRRAPLIFGALLAWSRRCISGPGSPGRCCSGRPSYSPGRSAPRSVISWTSRSRRRPGAQPLSGVGGTAPLHRGLHPPISPTSRAGEPLITFPVAALGVTNPAYALAVPAHAFR